MQSAVSRMCGHDLGDRGAADVAGRPDRRRAAGRRQDHHSGQGQADDRAREESRESACDTRDGIVHLEGKVPTADDKAEAERLARHTKGVRDVVNNLRVEETSPSASPRR